jgi:hypothetical protein
LDLIAARIAADMRGDDDALEHEPGVAAAVVDALAGDPDHRLTPAAVIASMM